MATDLIPGPHLVLLPQLATQYLSGSAVADLLRLGNGRNTVSGVLLGKRELTEFCGKLGEKLGELAVAH